MPPTAPPPEVERKHDQGGESSVEFQAHVLATLILEHDFGGHTQGELLAVSYYYDSCQLYTA